MLKNSHQYNGYVKRIGQGPDLVLLHGWGFNHKVWDLCLPLLTPHFTVTVLDLPGYGPESEANHFIFEMESITKELLKVIPEKAICLGWSLGGMLATYIAAHYPDRISQLVLVASSPCFIEQTSWQGMKISVLQNFYKMLEDDFEKTIKRFIALQFLGCADAKALNRQWVEDICEYSKPSNQVLQAGLELLKTLDLRVAFSQIQCPILSLYGRLDSLVPVANEKNIQALNNRCETIIFEKASHALFYTHSEQFANHLLSLRVHYEPS